MSLTAARCSSRGDFTEQCGGLDLVVANAGIASRGATVRAMSGEAVDRVLAVNLIGVYNTVITALPQIAARQGHVVVTSSVYAFLNGLGTAPYAMARPASSSSASVAGELVPHGAGASVAYFGFIDTEMVHLGIDQDPTAVKMMETLPKVLQKRLSPAQAARPSRAGSSAGRRGSSPRSAGPRSARCADPEPAARQLHAQG